MTNEEIREAYRVALRECRYGDAAKLKTQIVERPMTAAERALSARMFRS